MKDGEFVQQMLNKVHRCEPPQGQERVEEPPRIEDWRRLRDICRKLDQVEFREEQFCGDEDAHGSHDWEADHLPLEPKKLKYWCPGVKARAKTMIGEGRGPLI